MKVRFFSRLAAAIAVCFLALMGLVWAGYVVCPKCGYENQDTRTICSHCNAELVVTHRAHPKPEQEAEGGAVAAEPRSADAPSLTTDGYLDPAIVEEELGTGIDHLRRGDVEMARLFLRNAAALDLLTDPRQENDRSRRVVALLKRTEQGARDVRQRCPVCDGSGKAQARMLRLDGRVELREAGGKSCETCGGTGYITTAGTVSERKYRIGRALSRFATLEQGRKFVPVGGAWVPADIEQELTLRQIVQLRRACAAPCPECMGIGRVDCDTCKGTGYVKCPNKECVNGMVRVVKEGSLVKAQISRTEKCKICGGTGHVLCEDCKGKGSVLCPECSGTGEREPCSRCAGQGLAPCRRCGGTGKYRGETCATCGGEGSVLCTSCMGDGRKK